MIHPDTELRFIGDHVGYGVVATRLIPKGTITWVRDFLDRSFPPEAPEELGELYAPTLRKYAFMDGRGQLVLCWDIARYVNHSCDAPCLTGGGFDFEFAIRDIQPGEELCDDYGTLNTLDPFPCACGVKGCRGTVTADDARTLSDWWDQRIQAAWPALAQVPQPLMPLVADRASVERAMTDPRSLASCRDHLGPALAKAGGEQLPVDNRAGPR